MVEVVLVEVVLMSTRTFRITEGCPHVTKEARRAMREDLYATKEAHHAMEEGHRGTTEAQHATPTTVAGAVILAIRTLLDPPTATQIVHTVTVTANGLGLRHVIVIATLMAMIVADILIRGAREAEVQIVSEEEGRMIQGERDCRIASVISIVDEANAHVLGCVENQEKATHLHVHEFTAPR